MVQYFVGCILFRLLASGSEPTYSGLNGGIYGAPFVSKVDCDKSPLSQCVESRGCCVVSSKWRHTDSITVNAARTERSFFDLAIVALFSTAH